MKGQLAIPSAADFCTIARAAEIIGVGKRAVQYAIKAGKLETYLPEMASWESATHNRLLAVSQVETYAKAYKATRGRRPRRVADPGPVQTVPG